MTGWWRRQEKKRFKRKDIETFIPQPHSLALRTHTTEAIIAIIKFCGSVEVESCSRSPPLWKAGLATFDEVRDILRCLGNGVRQSIDSVV